MAVIVMFCFARSGGTLLNRCLGSLPSTVILSEVNPIGSGSGKDPSACRTVKEQALHWYGIKIKSDDFVEGILELEKVCLDIDQKLIIRDWSFVNFMPTQENNYTPAKKFLCLKALSEHTQIKSFAFVRDAIDIWISRGAPDNVFFTDYLSYVEEIVSERIPYFKYEDFCCEPEFTLKRICSTVGLDYSDTFKKYKNFVNVNGDVQIVSRGSKMADIKPLHRKKLPDAKIFKVNNCEEMIKANDILGYPTSFSSMQSEGIVEKIIRKVRLV